MPPKKKGKEVMSKKSKPNKLWSEIIEEEEETSSNKPEDNTNTQIQKWVDTLSQSPEMMVALQNISESLPASAGKISTQLSKLEKGSSSLAKTLSQKDISKSSSSFSNTQIVCSQSKTYNEYFLKPHYQTIAVIEDGFLYPNPLTSLRKMFSE